MSRADLLQRAQEYAGRTGLVLRAELGFGVHGIVFSAEHQTEDGRSAVKVHERAAGYAAERDVYLRLQEHDVSQVRGCNVPQLVAFDDQLMVIHMTIVTRPFVLDFAGAYLDVPPEFPDEILDDWLAEKQEQFGPRWAEVEAILRALEEYGIFLVDINLGNVSFGD